MATKREKQAAAMAAFMSETPAKQVQPTQLAVVDLRVMVIVDTADKGLEEAGAIVRQHFDAHYQCNAAILRAEASRVMVAPDTMQLLNVPSFIRLDEPAVNPRHPGKTLREIIELGLAESKP